MRMKLAAGVLLLLLGCKVLREGEKHYGKQKEEEALFDASCKGIEPIPWPGNPANFQVSAGDMVQRGLADTVLIHNITVRPAVVYLGAIVLTENGEATDRARYAILV